jgi:branched-subunit amino acid aminotransferase/4-amino-4-deoxychorismate lyase
MAENSVVDSSIPDVRSYPWYSSRGFQFGDGLFETALFTTNGVRFAAFHAKRLTEGMAVLQLQNPLPVSVEQYFESYIPTLLKGIPARLKLMVWRKGGGSYAPASEEADYLLLAMPYGENHRLIEQAHVVSSVQNRAHAASGFKTLSSLHYVRAAIEPRSIQNSMPLLATASGILCEGLQASLLFYKNGRWHRPSPTTGGIEGVVTAQLDTTQHKPEQVYWKLSDLDEETIAVLANATGVRQIMQIESQVLSTQTYVVDQLRALLFA